MAKYILQNSVVILTPDGPILFVGGRVIDETLLNFPIQHFLDAGGRLTPATDADAAQAAAIVRRYEHRGADPKSDANAQQPWATDSAFRVVVSLVERDAIFAEYRRAGMHVHVSSNGITYRLGAGLTNVEWNATTAATPGGAVKDFQWNNTVLAGATGFTRETSTNRFDTTARALEVGKSGSTYSATGDLNVPNGFSWYGRNAADSADRRILLWDSNNIVNFGDPTVVGTYFTAANNVVFRSAQHNFQDAGGAADFVVFDVTSAFVRIAAANPATVGTLRVSSGFVMKARDNANGANLSLLTTDASDNLWIGVTTSYTEAPAATIIGGGTVQMAPGGSTNLLVANGYLEVGTGTKSTGGVLRYANNVTGAAHRNSPNNSNLNVWTVDSSDSLELFGSTAVYGNLKLSAATGANTYVQDASAAYRMVLTSSETRVGGALAGDGPGSNTTFKLKEATWTQSSAADKTLANTEYGAPVLRPTGTPGGAWNIIAPNIANTFYVLRNETDQAVTIKKSGGAGFAVAANMTAQAYHNGTDYQRVTADV